MSLQQAIGHVKIGNIMAKQKVKKVIKGLEKASKLHAKQAKTYANAWLVKTYKKRGGGYKGAKKAEGGEVSNKNLKPIPTGNKGKGLSKLPTKVRNKMGFMKSGGAVMTQARGCGAIMDSKRKPTRVPRS